MHKNNEIIIAVWNEQQNLQLNNFSKKAFGAWTCNHSIIPHLTARFNRKAAANATAATQQTKFNILSISQRGWRSRSNIYDFLAGEHININYFPIFNPFVWLPIGTANNLYRAEHIARKLGRCRIV